MKWIPYDLSKPLTYIQSAHTEDVRKLFAKEFYPCDIDEDKIHLTNKFDIRELCNERHLPLHTAFVFLMNLESESVMKDLADGDYNTFDVEDPDIFNDDYYNYCPKIYRTE